MVFFYYLFPSLCALYCFFQLLFAYTKSKPYHNNHRVRNQPIHFCVLVIGRNEEEPIYNCISSILSQDYQQNRYELIYADDQSEDATMEVVQNIDHPLLQTLSTEGLPPALSPKKAVITHVVEYLTNAEYIVLTDADCRVPVSWLSEWNSFLQHTHSDIATAPVLGSGRSDSLLQRYQMLELTGLSWITFAGMQSGILLSANGGNMVFRRSSFLQVNGFEGNTHIASGDDVFLLQKFVQLGLKTCYNNSSDAAVTTKVETTWADIIQQRVRWVKKSSSYTHFSTRIVTVLSGLAAVSVLVSFLLTIYFDEFVAVFTLAFILKIIGDYVLLKKATKYFNRDRLMRNFILSECIQVVTTALTCVLAIFNKRIRWKGREWIQ